MRGSGGRSAGEPHTRGDTGIGTLFTGGGGGMEVSWVRDPICRKNGARLPHTGGRVWEALSLGETEVPLTGGGEREMRLGS